MCSSAVKVLIAAEVTTAGAGAVPASTSTGFSAAEHPTYAKAATHCATGLWLPAAEAAPAEDTMSVAPAEQVAASGVARAVASTLVPMMALAARVGLRAKVDRAATVGE